MTARERFRDSKELTAGFNDLMDSSRMQTACDAALLEYLGNLQPSSEHEPASANEFRRQGATAVLRTLQNLNAPVPSRTTQQPGQLNHGV